MRSADPRNAPSVRRTDSNVHDSRWAKRRADYNPHSDATHAANQPEMGRSSIEMHGGSGNPKIVNFMAPTTLGDLGRVGSLAPKNARRRSAPDAHQVITDEVGSEMYEPVPGEVTDLAELASRAKAEKEDGKGEPRERLNDSSTIALCGFGKFDSSLAVCGIQ